MALESDAFALLPSLAPLRPGHALVCPKTHVRSFAQLDVALATELIAFLAEARALITDTFGGELHLFEHGMAPSGGRTLCSTDHAHLHIVPMEPGADLSAFLGGERIAYDGSLRQLSEYASEREYISYQPPCGSAWLRRDTEQLSSQYMRRAFAKHLGRDDEWDWRLNPNPAAADLAWRRLVSTAVRRSAVAR